LGFFSNFIIQSKFIKILLKDEASSRRAQTSQGRNRRAEITNERREKINRRQHEYQRDRRARMSEEEREESKRKQREIAADK